MKKFMKKFLKYAKGYWPFLILGPILIIVEVMVDVQLPAMVGRIIDYGAVAGDANFIMAEGLKMIGLIVIAILSGVAAAYCAARASVGIATNLRSDLYRKIQEFTFSNIDQVTPGSLITRLTNDVKQVQNLVNMSLRIALRAPGMLIGALVMAFTINPSLSTIFIGMIAVFVVLAALLLKVAAPRFKNLQVKIDQINTKLRECLINVRVIKSFVRHDYERKRFDESNSELKLAGLRAYRMFVFAFPLMTLILNICTVVLLGVGGRQVLDGILLIGDLTALITYMTQILMGMMMLTMVFVMGSRAIASIARINEVLYAEIDITEEDSDASLQVKSGKITFKHVFFGYYKGEGREVLKDINLEIKPGELVGIVGSTGSGKTSMIQLIPRLYEVDAGEVLVDDLNVRKYTFEQLRSKVSVVLQNNVLFSGTIAQNLRWGDSEATLDELREVAQEAKVDEFIMELEDGYDTMLDHGGLNLSGGQRQRICIARALLRRPNILILDDSTSAVDTDTEAQIREVFKQKLNQVTKIVIAQRISSVIEADRIIVLNEGIIVGNGTHKDLMETCLTYQEIYQSQTGKGVDA